MAEIELGNVAVLMLFAAVLINAFHPALENAVEAFRRVDANFHAAQTVGVAIFLAGMINHSVFGEVLSEVGIGVALVSHDMRFAINVGLHDRNYVFSLG